MWHHIQRHKFVTRHVRVDFLVLLHVVTCVLTNRGIHTNKWHANSPLNTFVNKSERTLCNDILAHGKGDYRLQLSIFLFSVFVFNLLRGSRNGVTWIYLIDSETILTISIFLSDNDTYMASPKMVSTFANWSLILVNNSYFAWNISVFLVFSFSS